MSLKASKTCFGVTKVEFYGHEISEQGTCKAEHNIAPIETMVAPSSVLGLQRVLGLMVQHKDHIKDFSMITQCLHRLTRKNEPWDWTDECDKAFEHCRAECLQNKIMSPPDFTRQFYCDSDASATARVCAYTS